MIMNKELITCAILHMDYKTIENTILSVFKVSCRFLW